ncbi:MAG: hypothetical protein AAF411_12335 [Myxococcota bacterium]
MPYVYAFYLAFSAVLTVFLARTLFRHGEVLLADVFEEQAMAQAVNRLLVVGFYLVNFGYALWMMAGGHADSVQSAVETLASKLGLLLLSLAAMHFFNLFLFHRIRRRLRVTQLRAPVAPHGQLQAVHQGHAQAQWNRWAGQGAG